MYVLRETTVKHKLEPLSVMHPANVASDCFPPPNSHLPCTILVMFERGRNLKFTAYRFAGDSRISYFQIDEAVLGGEDWVINRAEFQQVFTAFLLSGATIITTYLQREDE